MDRQRQSGDGDKTTDREIQQRLESEMATLFRTIFW